ncbi:MAG: T9SS type A sorting domain-containing protein, partial [Bacteroidota bacterium]
LNHVRSNSTISIIDITGKEVITKLLSGYDSTIMINTNDMPAGIYILKLNSQKEGTYFVNKFQVVK